MSQASRGNGRIETRNLASGENTLGELRAFVEGCDGMPDDSLVTVRTGIGGGSRIGSRLTRISAEDDGRAGRL